MPSVMNDVSGAVIEWISQRAIGGVVPLSGARYLGCEYLLDESFADDEARAQALLRQEIDRHFTSGFLHGFAATIEPPPPLRAIVAAGWIVQARVAGALATVFHHELDDPRVRAVAIACLLGERLGDVVTSVAALAQRVALPHVLEHVNEEHLHDLAGRVQSLLLSPQVNRPDGNETAEASLNQGIDATDCYVVGRTAIRVFQHCRASIAGAHGTGHRSACWEPPS